MEDLLRNEIVRCVDKIVTVYSKLRQLEILINEFFETIRSQPNEMDILLQWNGISKPLEERSKKDYNLFYGSAFISL
jgi:hypothetical protein